jgi:redox-sensitive bicupin YhaK (pirin superfamily)
VKHELGPDRGLYLYVIEGDVSANGNRMVTGSAARIRDESAIEITPNAGSELIAVDVNLTWNDGTAAIRAERDAH